MLGRSEEIMLIGRVVAFDDQRAFGRLVDEYADALRAYLYNLCGRDASLAADLSQETFIKAYKSLRQFKGLAGFRTWLYRIAYNTFVDWSRQHHELLLDPDTGPPPEPEHDSADANQIVDLRHDLDRAMATLSPTERSLVLLFYYDDLPIKKIAKIMSLPEGTVKVYLSRAKSRMARFFNSPLT